MQKLNGLLCDRNLEHIVPSHLAQAIAVAGNLGLVVETRFHANFNAA